MKNIKITTLLLSLTLSGVAMAQESISYSDYESRVLEYNKQIKQSESQSAAMRQAMAASKSAFYPAIDAGGNYQYRINDYDMNFGGASMPMDHNTYSAEIGVIQQIYSGGAVRKGYQASKLQSQISDMSIELTRDNIIYAARVSYWGAVAQLSMYETMCEYTDIIEQLVQTLQVKYSDGLISKTDLLQMLSRKNEAELQRSNSHQSYLIAIQNMNIMMGNDPLLEIVLLDSIEADAQVPAFISASQAIGQRPDYAIASLGVEYQQKQIDMAVAKYNPSFGIGFKQSWGTQMINIDGSTKFNSNLFASVSIPIFRGGARHRQVAMQRNILTSKEFEKEEIEDKITKELAQSWTDINETLRQISIVKQSCLLAQENLELNTFSYNEGQLQITDVLSSQISWIQAYTSLIQTYYKQQVALADYYKAAGVRYVEPYE